ncbi:MAG: hypothetical protein PVJ64_09580 [Gemmatimonadales bacterium]
MVTRLLAALLTCILTFTPAELAAQTRISIGGNIGYYTVLGGRLFDDARPDDAPGFEAALRWVPQREFTVGGILQYVSYSSGGTAGDVERIFISLLVEGRYFIGAGATQPFLGGKDGHHLLCGFR